jgi:hypothetical protein
MRISNRGDTLLQMRRAAALHLQGANTAAGAAGCGEWVLLGQLLLQVLRVSGLKLLVYGALSYSCLNTFGVNTLSLE